MAIHLTPTELAREAGMERREVIEKCMEMGVPIFQGRIDKTLFLANLSEQTAVSSSRSQVATA
jgi:3-deoxy-D-manno-octulosonate 8-phosphate phosphatase KdsC-like HAD superfamily phosphatase